jgi:hypothetical protein
MYGFELLSNSTVVELVTNQPIGPYYGCYTLKRYYQCCYDGSGTVKLILPANILVCRFQRQPIRATKALGGIIMKKLTDRYHY